MVAALGNPHRRNILLGLHEGLITSERGAMARSGQAEEIRRDLEREHLPLLQDAGFVEWDPETGEISKGPNFEEIEPFLQLIQDHSDELPADWV